MDKLFKTVLIALIFSAVILTGCNKNKAPDTPSIPTGPTSGTITIEYTFTSSAADPDGDNIAIRFDWGNGDTSDWSNFVPSDSSVSMLSAWSDSGSYTIRAQAEDVKGAVSAWSGGYQIIIGNPLNHPPDAPSTPSGPSGGVRNVSYSFTSTAIDPDGDSIAIRFSWGDSNTSDWSTWKASGDSVTMSHSWSDEGTYFIYAQAKDKKDTTSLWSGVHPLEIEPGGVKKFSGSAGDDGSSVQPTTDDGYVITGSTGSYGASRKVPLIMTDAKGNRSLMKLSSAGRKRV